MLLPATAQAQENPPHKGRNNYVYCELDGKASYVEGQNDPSHPIGSDMIPIMKEQCLRDVLYGGQAYGYWEGTITDEQWRRAKFIVSNTRGN